MKAVIFDMYGVIMKAPEGDLIPYIRKEFPNLTDDFINGLWKEAALGLKSSKEFFQSIGYKENISEIEEDYLNTIEIDDNFYEIADFLKKDYLLALLSNDVSEWSQYLREKYRLNELFDEVVISGDHGILKPDIKMFEHILKRLCVSASDCYFIDDREKNLKVAAQMGMNVILFNRRNITYEGNIINNFQEVTKYV